MRPSSSAVTVTNRRAFCWPAAVIFVTALAVRLIHIVQLQKSPFVQVLMGDARGYDEWARRIAAGDWLGTEVFYQAPLYPYFMAVVYAIAGRDLFVLRVIQSVLGAGACVLVGLATAKLFSRRAGLLAGLLFALYAPALFVAGLIQKSALDLFLISLLLWFVAALTTGRPRPVLWAGLGGTLGALSLTRENALVLVAIVLVWSVLADRRKSQASRASFRWPSTAALLIGLTVALGPVVIRNQIVGAGLYLTTSQFGTNFYIGNNPNANGTYVALREGRGDPAFEREDATALAEAVIGRRLSAAEVSAFWRDRALQYIVAEPVAWLRLIGRKTMLLINATEMLDTEAQESHAEWSTPLRIMGWLGQFGVLLALGAFGVVATWRERRTLTVIYALTLGYAASVLLFFVFARYRYPLVPFFALLGGAGLDRLPQFWRQSTWRQRAVAFGIVVGVVAITRWPALSPDMMRAITETNLGVARQADRRLDDAISHYRRALAIRPDYAPAANNLGVALRAAGRLDEAIASYRHAIALDAHNAEVHYNLATALLEQQHYNEAIPHFQIARERLPPTAGARNNFGVALAAVGRRDEAIAEFKNALALEPDSSTTLRNLGDALAKQRQYAEAIESFRRITTLEPENPAAHYDFGNVLLEAGHLEAAADAFQVVIKLAPDSAQAHTNLGVALAAQGRIDEAISEFERALALNPDFAAARRYLAAARTSRRQ